MHVEDHKFLYLICASISIQAWALARVTYCTRLLYAALPSTMYAKKDKTTDTLMGALVEDFNQLYNDGFTAPWLIYL